MSLNRSATAVDCPPGMESALINAGQRIKYIDIARGLGIILVRYRNPRPLGVVRV